MSKISELPDAGPLDGAEFVPVVQDGQTRKTAAASLQNNPETPEFVDAYWLAGNQVLSPLLDQDLTLLAADGGGC